MRLLPLLIGLVLCHSASEPVAAGRARADTGFVFFNALDTSAIPKRISRTGLFRDIPGKTVNPGITRFEINAALWSDGAAKIRYLILPPDSRIKYREDSAYGFPTGTVLVKNFLIDTVQGDPSSRIYLETRLLVKQFADDSIADWYGFSYRWLRDQTDAELVNPASGLETAIPTYAADGRPVQKKWSFPSQSACWRCHMPGGRDVLGFHTAELNRPAFSDSSVNQLRAFVDAGLFQGADFPEFANSLRWAALSDSTQSLEKRARSYLAANCSFCHGAEGRRIIGTVLSAIQDFDYFSPTIPINYLNQPAKFEYGIPGSLLVHGGSPEKSILVYRMRNRGQDRMPPLATAEPDSQALRVISEWIATLPGPPAPIRRSARHGPAKTAWIRGKVLTLGGALPPGERPVYLFDGEGRSLPLLRLEAGRYQLESIPVPGMYWVLAGGLDKALPALCLP